jgi:hypothetical protein
MLGLITLAGGAIVIGISCMVDASGTVKLVVSAITIRGITWVIKKTIGSIDKDKADLINFTGWSICGISLVGILKNCKKGIEPIVRDFGEAAGTVSKIKSDLDGFAEWVERITFWD